MKLILRIRFTFLFTILTLSAIAGENKYILPNADYNAETPSEACFSGAITKIEKGSITVSGTENIDEKSFKIIINEETEIFTVYGGYVSPEQLKNGIKLKVWFKGSSCDEPIYPITAVRIMIASKRSGDDWPQ